MIEINNLTTNQIDENLIKKIAEIVFQGEKVKKEKELSLAFIGPGRMRKLNKKYRGKNRTTDVLAFPESEVPFEKFSIGALKKAKNLGEIVICPREVKKSSQRYNIPFEKELARVLVHGILHLLGYNHEKPEGEARQMKEKEEYYLDKLQIPNT